MYAAPNDTPMSSETRFSSAEPSTWGSSTQLDDHSPSSHSPPHWRHVGATFSKLSEQFQAASHAIAMLPPSPDHAIASLTDRLERLEEGQKRLEAEIITLKEQSPSTSVHQPSTDFESTLKEQIELFKLEQERLPARLFNALATKSLSPIKMTPMRNHKFPLNSPTTRGEFEHLTKERYEGIMTSYEISITGDTAAKRETLRAFLGIPSSPPEKK